MKWRKVRVGDFLIRVKDLITIEKDKDYSLVTIKLYHKGVQLRKKVNGSQIQADKMSRVKAGQFILSGIDARNGAFGIIPDALNGAVVTNDFWHFDINRNIMSDEYFLWLTSTPYFDDICKKASDGTTNRIRLQSDRFYSQELLIPEIQDQHIIVGQLKRTSSKIKLLKNEYEFQLAQLDNLNQAILQEAAQGKLVKQDPKDEPASELLKCIKAEKAKSGKKEKPLPPIKPEEIPFEIPENWLWCRLGEIAESTSGGTPDRSNPKYWNGNISWLKSGELTDDFIENESEEKITEEGFKNSSAKLFPQGTLLIALYGATAGKLGILKFESTTNQAVCGFFENEFYVTKYLFYYLWAFRGKIIEDSWGQAQPNISQTYLKNLPLAFPPISEQKRIVAEIERQFAKTKQLKKHIIDNQQATEQLLKALLHQAFEVKEDEVKTVQQAKGKVVELDTNAVNWDNLAAQPFEQYAAHPANNIQNIDWEMAMMVACMKNKLGITYGDVGLQKNVYNTNNLQPIFSKHYAFANSNFGTYCHELKEDLKRNPYLVAQKVATNKEVYVVNPKYSKQVLDKLSAPENKDFIQAINRMLSIYEHPFINKETDKIELYNTVLKVALDKNTRDIDSIYQGMKDWKINQTKFKTKAEKFSKSDATIMLNLLMGKKIL